MLFFDCRAKVSCSEAYKIPRAAVTLERQLTILNLDLKYVLVSASIQTKFTLLKLERTLNLLRFKEVFQLCKLPSSALQVTIKSLLSTRLNLEQSFNNGNQ